MRLIVTVTLGKVRDIVESCVRWAALILAEKLHGEFGIFCVRVTFELFVLFVPIGV